MAGQNFKPIAILGAGSWGTALALYLARQGQTVRLWSIESTEVTAMLNEKTNSRYLPGYDFPPTIHPLTDLSEAIEDCEDIVIVVPSIGFKSTLSMLKPLISPAIVRIICATKGLDAHTGQLANEIAVEILGKDCKFAVLSGPSFASEVAAGLPTSVVIASEDDALLTHLTLRFDSAIFHIIKSDDVTGVEIGGVVKNVIAIATGISDGLEYGANTRSAIITHGLAEMMRLGTAMGGHLETFTGLSGLGDLILTCSDNQSRNRRLGLAIGKGHSIQEAERKIGQVVEGKRNAELVNILADRYQVKMRVCKAVLAILEDRLKPSESIHHMLAEG